MKAPRLAKAVLWLLGRTLKRPADFIIGGAEHPYMFRWWILPRSRFLNVYHHIIVRSDEDRALHDHPWWSISFVLDGSMVEVLSHDGRRCRMLRAGDIVFRGAADPHRLEIRDHAFCKTLFITGPKIREWGFLCPQGWRHWRDFTAPGDSAKVGKGCEE